MVHKEDMDGRNPQGTQNELKLWHGTAFNVVNSINTNGFNRSYCGQHGAYTTFTTLIMCIGTRSCSCRECVLEMALEPSSIKT